MERPRRSVPFDSICLYRCTDATTIIRRHLITDTVSLFSPTAVSVVGGTKGLLTLVGSNRRGGDPRIYYNR